MVSNFKFMDMESEINALFAKGKWGHIRTMAENAWLEGMDFDANPYNRKYQSVEYYCWNDRWRMCNKWL